MFDPRGLIDVVLVLVVVLLMAPFFGRYLGRVFTDRPAFGDRFWNPIEHQLFRLIGTNPRHSMRFKEYTIALLVTSAAIVLWIFALMILQSSLPWNPNGIPGMSWDLALHTASSFTTNTDFTHFVAESQLSLGGAILGLQIALFLSAGTGLAVVVAFIRGFTRQDGTLGNFYVDLVRAVTRVLLPMAILGAIVLIAMGLPQTFTSSVTAYPMTGGVQTIYLGPVASWTSIEMLGSNGGGWYAANAANQLANPTVLSMLFQTGLMLLIPFSLPFMFGQMVRKPSEANPYIATILIVFLIALGLFMYFQYLGNPALGTIPGLTTSGNYPVGQQSLGTLPETSFFQVSSIYANVGAQEMALGSITPGAQMVSFFGMFTQSTPGGVGTGFGVLLVFSLVAVFIGGLMVGRTPEYLGKRVGKDQMRWSAFLLISHPAAILVPVVVVFLAGLSIPALGAVRPNLQVNAHQFSVLLYEFTSEGSNNGSAMGPIIDNTVFFNLAGSAVMLVGRFFPMIAMLAIGSLFSREEPIPASAGTLQTNSFTFTLYLTLLLIIIAGLLFLPVLALGPLSQIGG
ncbi:MAG TPA: potassium-transporting ATPase subunit KdpA [Thermoplasmata archaeon]|nr:potassium-transporting ATPase subunit KdpA [Thermoplasmata archaeon]